MTYSPTKFEDATSYGLGGDTFTRNVTEGRTHGRTDRQTDRRTDGRMTDRLLHEINIPFFLKKKAGIIRLEASLGQHSYPEYQHVTLAVNTTVQSSFRCH